LPTSAFQEQRPGPNFAGLQPHTNRSLEGHTNNFAPFAYAGSKTNPQWLAGALQRVPKLEAPLPMTLLGLTSTQALSPHLITRALQMLANAKLSSSARVCPCTG